MLRYPTFTTAIYDQYRATFNGPGATALAVDAGRTLLFDRKKLVELADATEISIQAFPPAAFAEPSNAFRGMNKV